MVDANLCSFFVQFFSIPLSLSHIYKIFIELQIQTLAHSSKIPHQTHRKYIFKNFFYYQGPFFCFKYIFVSCEFSCVGEWSNTYCIIWRRLKSSFSPLCFYFSRILIYFSFFTLSQPQAHLCREEQVPHAVCFLNCMRGTCPICTQTAWSCIFLFHFCFVTVPRLFPISPSLGRFLEWAVPGGKGFCMAAEEIYNHLSGDLLPTPA